MSELAEDTSADQGSSGEDSRSAGTGQTGSNADSSSGLGTGCTSIADEASSSGVPSLSSLQVKRSVSGGGGSGSTSSGSGTGSAGIDGAAKGRGGADRGSSERSGENRVGVDRNGNGGGGSTGSGATADGSTGSGGSEEGGCAYNSNSESAASSSGGQEGDDEMPTDSDGGQRRKKRNRVRAPMLRSSSSPGSSVDAKVGGEGKGAELDHRSGSSSSRSRGGCVRDGDLSPPDSEMKSRDQKAQTEVEVRQWKVVARRNGEHGAEENLIGELKRYDEKT